MPSTSERTRIYQQMVEDVLASGLLTEEEFMDLRDMLARCERKVATALPDKES